MKDIKGEHLGKASALLKEMEKKGLDKGSKTAENQELKKNPIPSGIGIGVIIGLIVIVVVLLIASQGKEEIQTPLIDVNAEVEKIKAENSQRKPIDNVKLNENIQAIVPPEPVEIPELKPIIETKTLYYPNGNVEAVYEGRFKGRYNIDGKRTYYDENGNLWGIQKGKFKGLYQIEEGNLSLYEDGILIQTLEGTFDEGSLVRGKILYHSTDGDVENIVIGKFKSVNEGFIALTEGSIIGYDENGIIDEIQEGKFRYIEGEDAFTLSEGNFTRYRNNIITDKTDGIYTWIIHENEPVIVFKSGALTYYDENGIREELQEGTFDGLEQLIRGTITYFNENGDVAGRDTVN